jgi:hypothetical protein
MGGLSCTAEIRVCLSDGSTQTTNAKSTALFLSHHYRPPILRLKVLLRQALQIWRCDLLNGFH